MDEEIEIKIEDINNNSEGEKKIKYIEGVVHLKVTQY